MIAEGGQITIQAVHAPQCFDVVVSDGKGRSVYISPKKNHEPCSLLSNSVCFPLQPKPAFSAISTSRTGALSVNSLK